MKFNQDKPVEMVIESLAFGGSGIGRILMPDGKKLAVFVEGAAPGDRVLVRISSKKHNYLIGNIDRFIEKSALRIEPRCKHFSSTHEVPISTASEASSFGCSLLCGGCSLQFLSYNDQLKIKEQHVRDAIKRIGGFDESLVRPIIGCANPWYYRNKMEFSFCRLPVLSLGLHQRRRHHDVIELTECFLMEPHIGEFVKKVRTFFRENALPGMELKSFFIREGKNTGEIMVNLVVENSGVPHPESAGNQPESIPQNLKTLNSHLPFIEGFKKLCLEFFAPLPKKLSSIYFTDVINKKGQKNKSTEYLLHGKSTITEVMHRPDGTELKFHISPQAFFQPNTRQAELLYAQALEAAALTGQETVFDLYCGAGTIGIFCANRARQIYGIEINKDAVKNAIQNAADNNIDNIEFHCGDTAALPFSARPDVIILDPPRNGLDPKALQKVVELGAPKIAYVSCNPATQARDLQLFSKAGYTLQYVQPVDMFPQTYHIESVAALIKK